MKLRTLFGRLIVNKNIFRKKNVQENIAHKEDTIIFEPAPAVVLEKATDIPENSGYRNITINMNMGNCDEQSDQIERKEKNYRNIK